MRYIVYIYSLATGEVIDLKMFQRMSEAKEWDRDNRDELRDMGFGTRIEEDRVL